MARKPGAFGYIIPKGPKDSKGRGTAPFTIRWRENKQLKQEGGYKTKTEAAEALARIRSGLMDGTLVEKRKARIGFDVVAQEWFTLHSKVKLRDRTHSLNEMNYRIHVAPFLGDAPLSAVTSTRILQLRAHLQAKVRTRKIRGADGEVRDVEYRLSVCTVNNVMALVRSILIYAVKAEHISAASTERLGRGELMLNAEKAKLAPPIERPQDVGRLLEAIRELRPSRYAMFATLIYTGARKGEVCGLKWRDVDLEGRMIKIRRSYGSGWTKSGKHRDVPIPPPLVAILRRHRLEEPYQGELVFPNDRGEAYTKNTHLEHVLRAALARIGLPQIRLHDLRHVYASHFLMAGGNIYDLQKNLGHHSSDFTTDVYGHLSADHRVKESDRLAGLFDVPAPAKVLPFEKRADSASADLDDTQADAASGGKT